MKLKLKSVIEDFSKEYSKVISMGDMGTLEYKIPFNENEIVVENFSQAGQDIFVLTCLNGKKNGTFLDLGCNNPIKINNTYLLEKKFNWSGLSIDIDSNHTMLYEGIRQSSVITEDCTNIDFEKVMKYYKSSHIDYLSLDLEPASITMMCLKNIPFDKVEFSLITFEHDSYRFGNSYRDESRDIFEKNGYKLICADVSNCNCVYEDWYYNPKYINYKDIKALESQNEEWDRILFKM
jgi:hypothetical protein